MHYIIVRPHWMLVRLWDIDKNPPQKVFIDLKNYYFNTYSWNITCDGATPHLCNHAKEPKKKKGLHQLLACIFINEFNKHVTCLIIMKLCPKRQASMISINQKLWATPLITVWWRFNLYLFDYQMTIELIDVCYIKS
jgi:hypothetical protein